MSNLLEVERTYKKKKKKKKIGSGERERERELCMIMEMFYKLSHLCGL
jgi:hypothetical protein